MTCTALTFNVHIKSPWIAANSGGVFCLGRLRSYAVLEELHSSYIEHHCCIAYIEIAIISCHHQMWYWQASLAAKGPGSSSLPLHGHSTWSFQFGYLYMTWRPTGVLDRCFIFKFHCFYLFQFYVVEIIKVIFPYFFSISLHYEILCNFQTTNMQFDIMTQDLCGPFYEEKCRWI